MVWATSDLWLAVTWRPNTKHCFQSIKLKHNNSPVWDINCPGCCKHENKNVQLSSNVNTTGSTLLHAVLQCFSICLQYTRYGTNIWGKKELTPLKPSDKMEKKNSGSLTEYPKGKILHLVSLQTWYAIIHKRLQSPKNEWVVSILWRSVIDWLEN